MPVALATHPFQVGDIVINSWGYDQTNVDAYQIVAVTAKSVRLARIAVAQVPGSGQGYNGMACKVEPVKDEFLIGYGRSDKPVKTVTKFPRKWSWSGRDEWSLNFTHGGTTVHTEGASYYCSWYA